MATNRPQGDRIGWRINAIHFRGGKTNEISSLDKKNLTLRMPSVGFKLTTFQSLSGGVTPQPLGHYRLVTTIIAHEKKIKLPIHSGLTKLCITCTAFIIYYTVHKELRTIAQMYKKSHKIHLTPVFQ